MKLLKSNNALSTNSCGALLTSIGFSPKFYDHVDIDFDITTWIHKAYLKDHLHMEVQIVIVKVLAMNLHEHVDESHFTTIIWK